MKKFNLAEALLLIAENNHINPAHITAISFEDGSGLCFNYSMTCGNFFARINPITENLRETGEVVRNTFRNP